MYDYITETSKKAVLIGLDLQISDISINESLEELALLAGTAGVEVIGSFTQTRSQPHQKYFIGSGKVEEVRSFLIQHSANLVIVDDEITATQERNLEDALGCAVIDRTRLILDIFALHASTTAGKLQVELAQLEYYLPRLRVSWHELNRIGGGFRTARGPGEQKIEVDRRIIGDRITTLKNKLKKIARQRGDLAKQRRRSFIKTISLAGYTNAGKSTLMNALTDAGVDVADKLFATLSPTTRQFSCGKYDALMTDTVGFIRKLPHQVVEAFMATLEQMKEADILLHVIDISSDYHRQQIDAVEKVLLELGVMDRPIIKVYNKVDSLSAEERRNLKNTEEQVFISARTGEGLDSLREVLELHLDRLNENLILKIPISRQDVISAVHNKGHVESQEYRGELVYITCRMDGNLSPAFSEFIAERIE
ncbi:MAG: GTPase HflX [Elusimicrobia bacterium]|nr:GTPase HflX [Elusimicrobiota bacterium]